jgi:branched-subunit amino acid ABC-type transport system permease component
VAGTVLAVPAIGFSAIYGVLRFPNFALASHLTIGAFAGYVANSGLGLPAVASVVVDGISGIPGLWRGRVTPETFNVISLVIVAAVVAIVLAVMQRVRHSPYGRVLRAMRDDDQVASVAGKHVAGFKVEAFALSAGVLGVAGALYAHYTSFIAPDVFTPLISIYVVLALTACGTGNNWGAVAGGALVVFFMESTRFATEWLPQLEPVQVAAVRVADRRKPDPGAPLPSDRSLARAHHPGGATRKPSSSNVIRPIIHSNPTSGEASFHGGSHERTAQGLRPPCARRAPRRRGSTTSRAEGTGRAAGAGRPAQRGRSSRRRQPGGSGRETTAGRGPRAQDVGQGQARGAGPYAHGDAAQRHELPGVGDAARPGVPEG